MDEKTRIPQESIIRALIHVYQHGTSAEDMLMHIENALEVNPSSEAVVQEFPDIWKMLVSYREFCKAAGVDIRRVHTIFLTRHVDNELEDLLRIDSCGRVTCTVPHGDGFDLVTANVALSNFGTLYRMMLDIYDRWKGEFDDANKKGNLCQIVVGVFSPYGEKILSKWMYGSQSTQPPAQILQFVQQCELVAKSVPIGTPRT